MIVDRILLKISIKQLNNVVRLDFSVELLVFDSKMSYIPEFDSLCSQKEVKIEATDRWNGDL